MRYIDLACELFSDVCVTLADCAGCALLTDQAVIELANNLPKLRRIGLVKVSHTWAPPRVWLTACR